MKSIPPVSADGQSLDYLTPVSAAQVAQQHPLIIEWGA